MKPKALQIVFHNMSSLVVKRQPSASVRAAPSGRYRENSTSQRAITQVDDAVSR